MEKSTFELQKSLRASKDYSSFFRENIGEFIFESIPEYLEILLKEKKLKKQNVIARSNLDRNYAYQIFNGTKQNPSRNKLLMLAIGMLLTNEETDQLLKMCKQSTLFPRDPRDSVIIYCIENKKNVIETNEMLYEHNHDLLE